MSVVNKTLVKEKKNCGRLSVVSLVVVCRLGLGSVLQQLMSRSLLAPRPP